MSDGQKPLLTVPSFQYPWPKKNKRFIFFQKKWVQTEEYEISKHCKFLSDGDLGVWKQVFAYLNRIFNVILNVAFLSRQNIQSYAGTLQVTWKKRSIQSVSDEIFLVFDASKHMFNNTNMDFLSLQFGSFMKFRLPIIEKSYVCAGLQYSRQYVKVKSLPPKIRTEIFHINPLFS